MRTPSMASTILPSTNDNARTVAKNRITNGTPMMRIASPADSESPVTTQVK